MMNMGRAFDRCEANYYRGRHSAIPGSGVFEFDDVIVCRRPASSVDFNKILGMTDRTLCRLPEFERLFIDIDVDYVIEATPDCLSPEGERHLTDLGFCHHGDMVLLYSNFQNCFSGQASSVSVVRVGSEEEFRIFLDVYQNGLGVPVEVRGHPAFSHWWTLPGWTLFYAVEGERPIGAAGLFIDHGLAYLATASTILEHRNRGAQTALLRHRIAHAKAARCSRIWSQTEPDSTSMRNMIRAGLAEFGRKKRLTNRRRQSREAGASRDA
jgi:hypothetical protein